MFESGTRLGHYEIESLLGRGGMGEVYRARDVRLRRPVAIKVLSPALQRDPDAVERFRQEADTASALNHPNILTIYDIGEVSAPGGPPVRYIAMEFIDGHTLRTVLNAGSAGLAELLGFLQQVASGLAKAHAAHIVHRDLKPENVMITTDGFAKILDFGLAKLMRQPEGETMLPSGRTGAGVALGTVGYMSPEQVAGRAIDFRSDIFAFGCMLYEALCGRQPFRGDTVIDTLHQVLHVEPAPLGERVSSMLAAVVHQCLQKDPERRYGSTRRLVDDLNAAMASATVDSAMSPQPRSAFASTSTARGGSGERSIVVLPFADLSPQRDHEYIGEGIADEIITALSRLSALRVIARNSAMRYRNTTKSAVEIARELDVHFVLTGSVRVGGERLRISTQLVDASADRTIWGDHIDGTLANIFDIQEQVARTVAGELHVQMSPEESGTLRERPIANPQAVEHYLRARRHIWDFTEDSLERALDELARAEELAGPTPVLLGWKAYVYWQYYNAGVRPDPSYLDQAEQLVVRIAALRPDSPNLPLLRGLIAVHRREITAAVRHLKRALAADRNAVDALSWLMVIFALVGRTEEARPLARRLRDVDPLNWMSRLGPLAVDYYSGAFTRAIEQVPLLPAADLTVSIVALFITQLYAQLGRLGEAARLAQSMFDGDPNDPFARLATILVDALHGRVEAARDRITPDLETMARADLQYSSWMAEIFAVMGDRERALDWLAHAAARGFINYPMIATHDRLLDNLRSDARFESLVEDIRARWLAFDA